MSFGPLNHASLQMRPRYLNDADPWLEHIPFAFLVVELCQPQVIVELGVSRGNSYCAFCQAAAEFKIETRCFGIDTWQGDPHSGTYGPEILQSLRAYHDPRYGSFSMLVQSTFDQAAPRFEEKSIDLLHIDGFHTYDAVKHDFETWLPKMTESGVVLFHDTAQRRDDFGVWRFWNEVQSKYPSFEFLHCNGLGVLGVGKDLPPNFADFLTTAAAAPEQTRQLFVAYASIIKLRYLGGSLIKQLTDLNNWKRYAGKTLFPGSDDIQGSLADPLELTRAISAGVSELISDNIQSRIDTKKTADAL
jgi:hypothetical protein